MAGRAHRGVVIGGSPGGAEALAELLAGLPAGFPAPLAAVLHRAKDSPATLIQMLQASAALRVGEAQDKERLRPRHVYVAPPDCHLLAEADSLALSTEAAVCAARPSIDVLFESAAEAWGRQAIGVLLTGAGADGAQGLACIKQRGGVALVQVPDTAASRVMPEVALAFTEADHVAAPQELGRRLVDLCGEEGE